MAKLEYWKVRLVLYVSHSLVIYNLHVIFASAQESGVRDSLHFQTPCNSTLIAIPLGQVTESHLWIVDMA